MCVHTHTPPRSDNPSPVLCKLLDFQALQNPQADAGPAYLVSSSNLGFFQVLVSS